MQVGASPYNIGSLSLLAHQPLPGYEPLPDFPEEQPDTSVRDVEELEGWSGSRTVVMETGFGSDSFDNRYRNGNRFNSGMASTAVSGVEALGTSSSMYKKKGNDYDLDAFYGDSSDEEDSSSEEEEETTSEEESDEEEEEEETDSEEEETSSGLSSSESEEEMPIRRK